MMLQSNTKTYLQPHNNKLQNITSPARYTQIVSTITEAEQVHSTF